jgi:hypothetical protein
VRFHQTTMLMHDDLSTFHKTAPFCRTLPIPTCTRQWLTRRRLARHVRMLKGLIAVKQLAANHAFAERHRIRREVPVGENHDE